MPYTGQRPARAASTWVPNRQGLAGSILRIASAQQSLAQLPVLTQQQHPCIVLAVLLFIFCTQRMMMASGCRWWRLSVEALSQQPSTQRWVRQQGTQQPLLQGWQQLQLGITPPSCSYPVCHSQQGGSCCTSWIYAPPMLPLERTHPAMVLQRCQ